MFLKKSTRNICSGLCVCVRIICFSLCLKCSWTMFNWSVYLAGCESTPFCSDVTYLKHLAKIWIRCAKLAIIHQFYHGSTRAIAKNYFRFHFFVCFLFFFFAWNLANSKMSSGIWFLICFFMRISCSKNWWWIKSKIKKRLRLFPLQSLAFNRFKNNNYSAFHVF